MLSNLPELVPGMYYLKNEQLSSNNTSVPLKKTYIEMLKIWYVTEKKERVTERKGFSSIYLRRCGQESMPLNGLRGKIQ